MVTFFRVFNGYSDQKCGITCPYPLIYMVTTVKDLVTVAKTASIYVSYVAHGREVNHYVLKRIRLEP